MLAGVYFYGQSEIARDLSRVKRQDLSYVNFAADRLTQTSGSITGDLYFLAGHSALRAAMDEPTPQHLDQLAERFADFSRTKGVYDQVRWIDETGKERVRVDLVKGEAVVIPTNQLQDKARRYYFADSFSLKPGKVFISPLDLNIEQDKIELPYKPMLRVAIPVLDSRGAKRGILILNYYGRVLLDAFAQATAGIAGHAMLANSDGYWLKSPEQKDEWGFMFNRPDLSLAAQAPAAWARIRTADNGQELLDDGLWTWDSVYPLLANQKSSSGAADAFVPSRGVVKGKQYVWKSVAHRPADALSALRRAVWVKLAAAAALLLGLLAFGAWKLAAADEAIRRLNTGLEQQVNARTLELRDKIAALDLEIAERAHAQSALKLSEDKFRKAFDVNPDAININRLEDGQYISINRGFAQIMGYTEDEIVGHSSLEFNIWVDPEDRGRLVQGLKQDGVVINLEARFRARDGGIHDGLMSAAVIEIEGVQHIISITRDITERKRAQAELHARELRYKAVADSASEAFVTGDADGRIVGWNASAERLFGYAETEIIGQPLTLLIPERYQEQHREGMTRVLSGGERHVIGKSAELNGLRKDATEFPLELSLAEWAVGSGRFFTGIMRDITQRKLAEAQVDRLTRLYAALSQCNQAIVRCASEEELLQQICRIAVEFGGMKGAWIGFVDPDSRMVHFESIVGERADAYLQGVEISVDADSPFGRGFTGIAIREDKPIWCQDFLCESPTAPWHERRAQFGFRASASLPLHRNGFPAGVLTLYAGEVGAFDEAARNLLMEMATDIDFALDNFARETRRAQVEKDLQAAEEQFRGLVEQSIAGICIIQDGKYVYVNPRFAEIRGYGSADELIGREAVSMVAEQDRGAFADKMRRLLAGEMRNVSSTHTALCKHGSRVEVGANMALATYRGRSAIVGILQDISEKARAEREAQRYLKQLQTAFMRTVEVATSLSEMRDPYTAGHERRVGTLAAAIGAELGFDAQRIEGLRVAGYLHDVGKITIPAEILSKPGKLSSIEYQLIQGHPQSGYDVLKDVEFPWPVAQVALQHHERMDGSGYPNGLKGEAILLDARIMAVADVVEAMASHRPYRPGLGIDNALAEIERGRGSAYDAAIADACLRLFREKAYQLLS